MYNATKQSKNIVTLNNFKEFVNAKHINSGKSMYLNKKVRLEENENGKWLAFIDDKLIFQVNIMIVDEIRILKSDCGCISNSIFCRHSVATLYTIRERLGLSNID